MCYKLEQERPCVKGEDEMEGKKAGDSCVVMTQIMRPQDANMAGNVHGGVIMYHIDNAAGSAAMRHARSLVVTASIDRLDFHNPVHVGDMVTVRACVNFVGKTSMEVGVRVEAENILQGLRVHTASAYLTFVAIGENGRPALLPPLILETEDEIRRNHEAKSRRQTRLAEKTKEKQCQVDRNCPT
jgi:acyl-CoA hydrolase